MSRVSRRETRTLKKNSAPLLLQLLLHTAAAERPPICHLVVQLVLSASLVLVRVKMEHSDENITQFLAFTGSSDTDTARSYLEMSGGSVETAVGLWLEHNGGGGGGVGGGDFGVMGGGSGGAAAAAAAPAGGGSFHGADAVRAPDRTRTEALIGPAGGHGAMAAAMAAGGMFAPGAMSGAEAAMMSAFAAASDDDDDDHMEYVGGGEGSGSVSRSGSVSAAAFDAREAVNESS